MHLLTEISKEQIKLTDWIQAGSSLITVFVAIVAIYFSRKMMHIQFHTFVRPISLGNTSHSISHYKLNVFNVGPGIAYGIKVRAFVLDEMIPIIDHEQNLLVLRETRFQRAIGPTEMLQNQSIDFDFEYSRIILSKPFIIEWETVSGKRFKTYWMYPSDINENFYRITGMKLFVYKIHWFWDEYLKTPYMRRKFKRLQKLELEANNQQDQ